MIAVKGRYDGTTVTLDRTPAIHECEVIVTFLEPSSQEKPDTPQSGGVNRKSPPLDDGSLACLFKNYTDDGIREPVVDFGKAVGNEQW